PLLVVVATRPPQQSVLEQMVTELLADPGAAIVRPMSLGPESIRYMTRELLGRDPDAPFVKAIFDVSGGNPLFVIALLHTMKDEGLDPSVANAGRVHEIG